MTDYCRKHDADFNSYGYCTLCQRESYLSELQKKRQYYRDNPIQRRKGRDRMRRKHHSDWSPSTETFAEHHDRHIRERGFSK